MDSFVQKIMKYKDVVRIFLQNPEKRYTPLELSRISQIPYASVWRLIQKLKAKKVILVERIRIQYMPPQQEVSGTLSAKEFFILSRGYFEKQKQKVNS